MRALIQRVSEAAVRVDGETVGEIGPGLLVLVCAMEGDTEANANTLEAKISKLRIFNRAPISNRTLTGNSPSSVCPPNTANTLCNGLTQRRLLPDQRIDFGHGMSAASLAITPGNSAPVACPASLMTAT